MITITKMLNIIKTRPYFGSTPIEPRLYKAKPGFTGVYTIIRILSKTQTAGGRQNRHTEAVLTGSHNLCSERNKNLYQKLLIILYCYFRGKLYKYNA